MDVDYLGFANGIQNQQNQSLQSLAQALQYRQQMQRQAKQDELAQQLHDLQFADLKEKQDYRAGLKREMANPRTLTTLIPPPADNGPGLQSLRDLVTGPLPVPDMNSINYGSEAMNSLRSNGYGTNPNAAQFQPLHAVADGYARGYAPGAMTTSRQETPEEAGARYASSQGRPEEAAKFISLGEVVAKKVAEARAYGDPSKAAQIEMDAQKMGRAAEIYSKLKKAYGAAGAKAQAANMPDVFGGTDLSQISDDGPINYVDLPNGQQVFWSDENPGQIHLTAAPPKTDTAHNVQEVPSADGKTAQKWQYNPQTQRYDIPVGKPYLVKSQVPSVNIIKEQGQKDFKNESAMRKEFLTLPEVKDFPTIESNAKRAVKALQSQGKSNVAVDQTIITVFNKMLDPASVVRESEYARTPQDLSLLSRIKGKWDKIQRGGAGLDSSEREALARMVTNFSDIASQQYNDQVTYYSDLAKRYGYKPENIVRLGGRKAATSGTPGGGSSFTTKGGFKVTPVGQ